MTSIAFDVENEKHFSSGIQEYFRRYQISGILKNATRTSRGDHPILCVNLQDGV